LVPRAVGPTACEPRGSDSDGAKLTAARAQRTQSSLLWIAFNIPDFKLPFASSYLRPSLVDSDNAASALYRPLGTLLESRPPGQGELEIPLFLWRRAEKFEDRSTGSQQIAPVD
jgi:hypothetical protein